MTIISKVTKEVKIDIQATGDFVNEYLERKIDQMTRKLALHCPALSSVSLHFNAADNSAASPKSITVQCSVPGPDVVASDTGIRWKIILKNVEKKLLRQLEKKKSLPKPADN